MPLSNKEHLLLRPPRLEEGLAVHRLVQSSPPLDLNSSYNYFLLCSHFADTCVIGEQAGEIRAFLSAYRMPQQPDHLFVWQVAVDASLRGRGVAGRMLEQLLNRPACAGVRYLETTVSPSNIASRRVFERLAAQLDAPLNEGTFLTAEMFGEASHEEERLLRVGPFDNLQHGESE